MIWCHLIFWSITFDAILGHIYVLDEIYRFSRSCMLVPIREIYAEMMACSLFYDNPSVQPLWSHSARPTIQLMAYWGIFPFQTRFTDLHGVIWSFPLTGCAPRWWPVHYCYDDFSVEPLESHPIRYALLSTQMPSCPSIRDMHLGSVSMTLLWIQMTRITYLLMHDLRLRDFSDLSLIWCHTGAYFSFRLRFADSTYLRDCLQLRDMWGLMIWFHFVMTLRQTFPWVVLSSSHFPMLVWFLDGVVSGSWILASSFCQSTYQIFYASPSSYSWVIKIDRVHLMPYWGIFPHLAMEMTVLITNLLQLSSLGREILYLLYGSLFWWCSSRWAFNGARRSGCDCLTICDSSVDCCIEIMVVTLSYHFFGDSLVDHSVLSFRLASGASFETHGVSFRPFQWIESYGDMLHWAIFPYSLAFRATISS